MERGKEKRRGVGNDRTDARGINRLRLLREAGCGIAGLQQSTDTPIHTLVCGERACEPPDARIDARLSSGEWRGKGGSREEGGDVFGSGAWDFDRAGWVRLHTQQHTRTYTCTDAHIVHRSRLLE